jgi:Uma2 family endonuclease
MATIGQVTLMTTEEQLALPENGMERELIRGELRERPATFRDRFHGLVVAKLGWLLNTWSLAQGPPRGAVYGGQAGCVLRREPDSTVGIDIAYLSPEQVARQGDRSTLLEGPPTLAVEVLSPNDRVEEIHEKLGEYLANGVLLVWIIDPYSRTVTVHRPDAQPILYNMTQELTAEPHLPGFRARVADLFN